MTARVVAVGSLNVDLVARVAALPGPGETVIGPGIARHGGGKSANAAVAAARLGSGVSLVAAVGDDLFGSEALDELSGEGIDVRGVDVVAGHPTGAALIVVDANGENQIAVGAGANSQLRAAHVRAALDAIPSPVGCVVVGAEVPDAAVVAAVRWARERDLRCILNPAPARPELLEAARWGAVLTPNAGEARVLAAAVGAVADAGSDGDVVAARALSRITREAVVVTLGPRGALVVRPDGSHVFVPSPVVTVLDTTGAGDTFNGALATRVAAGDALEEATAYAVVAAALSIEHHGARSGMPDAARVAAAMAD